MANDVENADAFDEEELAEGFEEDGEDLDAIADDLDLDADDVTADVVDDEDVDDAVVDDDAEVVEEPGPVAAPVADEDDLIDDADVELALDEVLAETILRKVVPEDDDDTVVEIDGTLESTETILPKQDDEFRCRSCRLLKKTSQLADRSKMLCRDCV
jgi:Domain of unknown function (DUF4193)